LKSRINRKNNGKTAAYQPGQKMAGLLHERLCQKTGLCNERSGKLTCVFDSDSAGPGSALL